MPHLAVKFPRRPEVPPRTREVDPPASIVFRIAWAMVEFRVFGHLAAAEDFA